MQIKLDFRLLIVSLEIEALQDNLNLIKKQMQSLREENQSKFDEYCRVNKLTPNDPEWYEAMQRFYDNVEFIVPRFFIGSFIVSVYSVFETSVTEIAKKIQNTQRQYISLNDLKGNFLERAKKYFDHILHFKYYSDDNIKVTVEMLADLRNAIAHANGRLEMLTKESRKNIEKWKRKENGITFYYDYLLIDIECASEIFYQVQLFLKDLVKRYKDWNTEQNAKTTAS